ncbi:uncharacterized protein J4E78_000345 [Alternaria triticimaculans]|uniref:uncharacterized protein n=1 Tax=Alternaria triticimaculans TaxID=297637 RepID=UPI0020C3117E|nr:uncharacterized protein J4E78_000345 [Alternaria triticimaculans]KAI4671848.1 hypothetical protein J4E78_000345 [Alternaria triticimaculans]
MAEEDTVSGEGWISDDSSFYGDEDEQLHQSKKCESFKTGPFWRAHAKDLNTIAAAARTQAPPSDGAVSDKQPAAMTNNFDMSGLDRQAMEQERLARQGKRKREPSPVPTSNLELFNPLEGQDDAWQLGEPVDDFVRRLPPYTTSISTCPWIWAANPYRNPRDKSPSPRVQDFTSRGTELLQQSLQTRRDIQKEGAKGPRGMVTKQLLEESKALQERISDLAKDTHVLSGKVATDDGKDERLICVYTKDFLDADDVLRVLHELETMGLINVGRTIYYKPDAYTYLDLRRETAAEYGLQASLYNSRTLLAANKVSKSSSFPQKKQSTLKK